ncbi:NAD(P)-binding protein [Hesseltinella vesiculosa]|uniref:NAD(P)-binding protein n=1 Tax=Hesseltinella vesiculosa TaxID=101127 RepID=A0A1X2GG10_9FUNG|nr:NAD(P)-binding protein [Hesseltinella vesiculosa]
MIKTVAIIGAGSIGGTVAFGLLETLFGLKELLLVDMSPDIVQAQATDLQDCAAHDTIVRSATFKEAAKCDLVLLTANVPTQKDEESSEWVSKSIKFIEGITSAMVPLNPAMTFVVATEPVDHLVNKLRKTCSLPADQIFGVGHSSLCDRRFHRWYREMSDASTHTKVNSSQSKPRVDIGCWVIGSGLRPLVIWPKTEKVDDIKSAWPGRTMFSSSAISDKKGDIWYGPSGLVLEAIKVMAGLVSATPMVLCSFVPSLNLCTSFPCLLGPKGVQSHIDLGLTTTEHEELLSSVNTMAQLE